MSYMLPHLKSGWAVDQAILGEEERVVVIRFGHDWDRICMRQDEVLLAIAENKEFRCYICSRHNSGSMFNEMYELYDCCTTMFL
eukprot:UN00837